MEDGFIEIVPKKDDYDKNLDNYVKRVQAEKRKRKDAILITIISIIGTILISGAIILGVNLNSKNSFENYFGGYGSAKEYVNNLIKIDKLEIYPSHTETKLRYGIDICFTNKWNRSISYLSFMFKAYYLDKYVESPFDEYDYSFYGPYYINEECSCKSKDVIICKKQITHIKVRSMLIQDYNNNVVRFNNAMLDYINEEIYKW